MIVTLQGARDHEMCDWRRYLCKRGVCGLSFCGLCDGSVHKGNMFKHIIILKELDI